VLRDESRQFILSEARWGKVYLYLQTRLLSKALSYRNNLNVVVANPMVWWAEVTTNLLEGEENDSN
jgi:hypothetical protein